LSNRIYSNGQANLVTGSVHFSLDLLYRGCKFGDVEFSKVRGAFEEYDSSRLSMVAPTPISIALEKVKNTTLAYQYQVRDMRPADV